FFMMMILGRFLSTIFLMPVKVLSEKHHRI
ncbi:uncharacterized protein Dwil_GK28236, partial [Drosophila willistoni]